MENIAEIKKFMAEKIAENVSLSDIQTMVNEKFNAHMTFMDIRILASELEVDWRSEAEKNPPAEEEKDPADAK